MEKMMSLPVVIDQNEPFPDCVNVLLEILNSTRDDSVRREIGEMGGINKLKEFTSHFTTHPSTYGYLTGQTEPTPLFNKTATNLLRVFRNLCVNSKANQDLIREAGVCNDIVSFLLVAEASSPTSDTRIAIRSGVQFFGNFVTSNSSNAEYLWKLVFPGFFETMLASSDDATREHTVMVLYNCVRPLPSLRAELVASPFFKELIGLLVSLQESEEQVHTQIFQWTYFILLQVFSDNLFQQCFESLRIAQDPLREQELQLGLLKVLDVMVEKVAEELPRLRGRGDDDGAAPVLDEQQVVTPACCSFFVTELGRMYNKDFSRVSRAAHEAHVALHGDQPVAPETASSEGSLTTAKPVTDVATALTVNEFELIYFMLRVLGHVTSLVEECQSTRLCKNGSDLRTNLGKQGLLAIVIGTLRGAWELEQAAKARKDKSALFAPGYKRELLGLIANMAYDNKQNQDEIRELGGVHLVLNHCNIDDNNPFQREWALFAIRNLLHENEENQAIVKGLKAEKVADTHGMMEEMGVGAELVNGVLKFKQTPKKTDDNSSY